MISIVQGLGESPFFGAKPDLMVLLECTAGRVALIPAVSEFRRIALANAETVRFALGLSSSFFAGDKFQSLAPRNLRDLRFNGDSDDIFLSRASDLLFAFGGSCADVSEVLLRVRTRCFQPLAIELQACHVGKQFQSGRNHLGFLDGTSNLQELDDRELEDVILVQKAEDPRHARSSYLVLRKYTENLALWSSLRENVQEQIIGRRKISGTFLSGARDWKPLEASMTPTQAHITCAHDRLRSSSNSRKWSERMYRCSMLFEEFGDGNRETSGILFMALARDPQCQVERIHNERILPAQGAKDLLLGSGYVVPTRSSLYFLPSVDSCIWESILTDEEFNVSDIFSKEWFGAIAEQWNASDTRSKLAGFGSILFVTDSNDSRVGVQFDLDGNMTILEGLPHADALSGSELTWSKIVAGTIEPTKAFLVGELKFSGSAGRLLKGLPGFEAMIKMGRGKAVPLAIRDSNK